MNLGQFKDPVSHICVFLALSQCGSIQEVAGSNPYVVMTNILVTEFNEFNENI